jgi:nucleolar GTP-binding protein
MDSSQLLDIAFHQAAKEASAVKQKRTVGKGKRHIEADLARVRVAGSIILGHLRDYHRKTEHHLNAFEQELIGTVVDIDRIARDEKRIWNSLRIINKLMEEFESRIKYADNKTESNRYQTAFYGRVSSIVKRIKFDEIEKFEKELKKIPRVREMRTIIICGYPNVGKSLILKNLTGHKVEVASYPFTTKGLLVGFLKKDYDEIQMIDTPGLLDRSVDKMNPIERRAALALKYLSKDIIFTIDPSESCGYSIESQKNLLKTVEKEFKPRMLIVATHADLPQKEVHADMNINSNDMSDIKRLESRIFEFFGNH